MRAGDTFRLQGVADRHTWIVVSDPEQDSDRILCVAFTSWAVGKDPTCIIRPEQFPILSNATCIDYFDVKVASVAALVAGGRKGLIQMRTPAPPELLAGSARGSMPRATSCSNTSNS